MSVFNLRLNNKKDYLELCLFISLKNYLSLAEKYYEAEKLFVAI